MGFPKNRASMSGKVGAICRPHVQAHLLKGGPAAHSGTMGNIAVSAKSALDDEAVAATNPNEGWNTGTGA